MIFGLVQVIWVPLVLKREKSCLGVVWMTRKNYRRRKFSNWRTFHHNLQLWRCFFSFMFTNFSLHPKQNLVQKAKCSYRFRNKFGGVFYFGPSHPTCCNSHPQNYPSKHEHTQEFFTCQFPKRSHPHTPFLLAIWNWWSHFNSILAPLIWKCMYIIM